MVLAIFGALLLGGASVLLLVVLPHYVEGQVLAAAEAQGLTLKPEKISFGWGWVRLNQVEVNLDRVRSVAMQVGQIDVALDRLVPLSIQLSNVEGVVTGSLTNVGLELSEWTESHPSAYSLPLSAKNIHARFVEPAGTPPWLELSGGELTHTTTGGVFAAQHTRFLDVDLGRVGAGFTRAASAIALGFGESDLSRAPFRVEVSGIGKAPTATFTLAPISAERLAKPLGLPLPVAGVVASSRTTIAFASGVSAGSISGTTSITLKGYIPPHPFELDGFIFGDTTTFDTKFSLPATRNRITLSDAQLKAGSFELHGDGLLARGSDHSEITVNLSGKLPCSALAAVEAQSRLSKILGQELGAKAGKFAQQVVGGSVAIGLKLSADTRNLLAAHIDRTIGVGCGLHPLTLAELSKLMPLPTDLSELLQNLPALPTDLSKLPPLPALPNDLPGLLGLPTSLPPPATTPPAATTKPAPASSSKPSAKPTATGSQTKVKPAASGGG